MDHVKGQLESRTLTLHGKGDIQHDRRLHAAMKKRRKSNLGLNYDKLQIKQKSVKLFGNIYSAEGVRADPKKVAAIADMRPPEFEDLSRRPVQFSSKALVGAEDDYAVRNTHLSSGKCSVTQNRLSGVVRMPPKTPSPLNGRPKFL